VTFPRIELQVRLEGTMRAATLPEIVRLTPDIPRRLPREAARLTAAHALALGDAATREELRTTGQNAAWPPTPVLAGGSS
jgi:hypothetical protein